MRVLLGLNAPDTHGIKAFDAKRTKPIVAACRQSYDLFDSEMILRAERESPQEDSARRLLRNSALPLLIQFVVRGIDFAFVFFLLLLFFSFFSFLFL